MRITLHTTLAIILVSGCDSSPPPFVELTADYVGEVEDLNPSDDLTGYSTLASATWSFEASRIEQAQVEFDLQSDIIKQYGSMGLAKVNASVEHVQLSRSQNVEIFKQGTKDQSISEFFKQNENDDAQGLLDVLIVIDNSGSMSQEQINLSTKLVPLLSYVAESDWKIGIVTTDASDSCLRDVITKGQSDAETAFRDAINAGTSGSGLEAGVPQAVRALDPSCLGGSSWIRNNSTLAVLFVSDEDNCSNGSNCATPEHNTADYLLDYLSTIREVGVNAKVFGLIWHASQEQAECPTADIRGDVYSELITATSGGWGSICDADYSSTLQAMSLDLSQILKSQFALNYTPFLDSVEVIINGQKVTTGYSISGNVIEFDDAPEPGAQIYVNYRFTTDTPSKEFTLASAADPAAINVYLDGHTSTDYSYDASKRKITFAKAPQAKEIKVTYKNTGALATEFLVETGLDKSDMKVYVNGSQVNEVNFNYNASTGNVSLATAPTDAATIKIDYKRTVGPELEYPIFGPEDVDSVTVTDGLGGSLDAVINGNLIIFSEDEFEDNKTFVITYANPYKEQYLIDLGYIIWGDTLSVSGANTGACEATLTDTVVDIRSCGFDGSEIVTIGFNYVRDHSTSFSLEDTESISLDSLNQEEFAFIVYVNDEVTEDFVIDGTTVTFDELPIGAVITVKLYRGHDS